MSLELTGLVSSVSALNGIAKTVIDALKAAKLDAEIGKFQQAILEANSYALTAQQHQFSLTTRIQELEKENTRLKDWSSEKLNYSVREVANGVFAYTQKDGMGDLQNMQKFCCNCFDQGTKSILQQSIERVGRGTLLTCHRCKSELRFHAYKSGSQPPPPPPERVLTAP